MSQPEQVDIAPPSSSSQREAFNSLTRTDFSLLFLVQIATAGSLLLSKVAINDMPALLFSALRYFIVAAMLAPLLRWHRGQMHLVGLIALCAGSLSFGLTNVGLGMAKDVAPVAIAVQLSVPFATLLAVLFLGERLTFSRLGALAITFAGVAVMGFDPAIMEYGAALLWVVAGALATAATTILMRKVTGIPIYQMQAWLSMLAWPPLVLASAVFDGPPIEALSRMTASVAMAVAWMVVCASLIGQAAYYQLMQRHEVNLTGPFMLLAPVLAAAGGVLFLGDVITWRMVVGGTLALAGVLIITVKSGRNVPNKC